ncbi:hypothetical protein CkaCkLH20_09638 [Colletotrichum karsti]|uniref:Heterokaryon incompatibility domain-containing protein n=1 Tax=Colletotrichum karsti TaxID=1095194 RepID=A0A9P6LHN2_9PEZI|nr:uncharacterized protein CkaCkLH20_09638 [Colletotrichum karsti]KAF9872775.1 hypothetical protein CkaCkLH20_09638 [Colletotrichum karsti]
MSAPSLEKRRDSSGTASPEPGDGVAPVFQTATVEPDGCRVCSDILVVIRMGLERRWQPVIRHLGNMHSLMQMPCPHAQSMRRLWEFMELDNSSPHQILVAVATKSGDLAILIRPTEKPQKLLKLQYFELVGKPDQPGHLGTSRLTDSQWIDQSIPRSWHDECLMKHGAACAQPPSATPGRAWADVCPEWLIDVEDLCIVPSNSTTTTYFTLSYTWGVVDSVMTTKDNVEMLRRPGSLHPDNTTKVPRTVRDAINITRSLGCRYVWIDRLCIIQDDHEAMSRNLNIMHQIYASSALCLVAFSGKDADHGLRGFRGISEPRCLDQNVLDLAGGEQLAFFRRAPYISSATAGDGSDWAERGWTLQEFLFAKRRLIFTDGPLRWVCSSVTWYEETRDGAHQSSYIRTPLVNWMGPEYRSPCNSWICDAAGEFSGRHLTLPGDAPRAFLGLQNFLSSYFEGGLIYGHPQMFFEGSLLWGHHRVKRRVASTNATSREGIVPSWSWLAWQGSIQLFRDSEYMGSSHYGLLEPVAKWFAMKSPSSSPSEMHPIKSAWHQHKTLAQKYPEHVPEGWIKDEIPDENFLKKLYRFGHFGFHYPVPVPSRTEVAEPPPQLPFIFARTARAFFLPRPLRPGIENQALCLELYTSDQEFAGVLYAHDEPDMDHLLSLETVELVAVAKGWSERLHEFIHPLTAAEKRARILSARNPPPHSDCYFVLCIGWEHGVATRQGSGVVLSEAWEKAQEPVDLILG